MIRPHPSDDELAGLVDESLPEGDARALRGHLEGCAGCRARVADLDELVSRLSRAPAAAPARVSAIVRAATSRATTKRPSRLPLAAMGAALAAAAIAIFVALVPGRSMGDGAFQARGGDDRAPPEVHLLLHAVLSPDGQQSARLADGDVIEGPLALSATLQALPGGRGRYAAVLARDAEGRVTWLLPSWLSESDAPRCLRVPDEPAVVGPAPAVLLEDLPPGALEVAVLALDRPCSLPVLDDAFEGGASLRPGAVDGLVLVERLTLFVREAS